MVDWEKNRPPIVGNKAIGTKFEDPKTLALSGEKPFVRDNTNSIVRPPIAEEQSKQKAKLVVQEQVAKPKEKKKSLKKGKPRQTFSLSQANLEYLSKLSIDSGIESLNGTLNQIVYEKRLQHPLF